MGTLNAWKYMGGLIGVDKVKNSTSRGTGIHIVTICLYDQRRNEIAINLLHAKIPSHWLPNHSAVDAT